MRNFLRFTFLFLLISLILPEVKAQEQTREKFVKEMSYLLYLPDNYNDSEEWPLMVFLHGAGERGDDLDKVKVHGPPKLIEQGREFPFVVVSPQVPLNDWWRPGMVVELIQYIVGKYHIDKSRIYLTGLSMGGYGTWETAMRYPQLFAAIAPVCGGGDTTMVHSLLNVPVWNFHGAKDTVVPLEGSDALVNALRKAGGEVRYTVYPEATHDSWTDTYNNDKLYKWLLSKEKSGK